MPAQEAVFEYPKAAVPTLPPPHRTLSPYLNIISLNGRYYYLLYMHFFNFILR